MPCHRGVARPLRIDRAGAWHHVMGRGNGGDALFRGDTDRRRFLGLLSEIPERFSVEVHAFVLVDNHCAPWMTAFGRGRPRASDPLRRGGAGHPAVLETGARPSRNAGFREGARGQYVKGIDLTPLPSGRRRGRPRVRWPRGNLLAHALGRAQSGAPASSGGGSGNGGGSVGTALPAASGPRQRSGGALPVVCEESSIPGVVSG